MKSKYVIIDHCVLIGASHPQESFYKECKSLFDYFKKNPVGIVTNAVKKSAKEKITQKYNLDNLEALNANLDLLKVEELDCNEVEDNFLKAQEFYIQLPEMVRRHVYESKRKAEEKLAFYLRGVPEHCINNALKEAYKKQVQEEFPSSSSAVQKILQEKVYIKPPSIDDAKIIAEACCLQKIYGDVLLASTDTHLSPIRLDSGIVEPFISDSIEEEFQIICNWPTAIVKML
jgi:transcription-repair coupling factor (superfamily II helicase)